MRSQYQILELIGQGQFGRVYRAIHRQSGDLVAVKELEQRRFSTHKFLRELRFLLGLQHPNIVSCLAIEHTKTGRYIVMDYCAEGNLRNIMQATSEVDIIQKLKLVVDLLSGLAHAHAQGVIHCDIKPENILLSRDKTELVAHLSDFGIARFSQEIVQENNLGSPAYMAPEQFYGKFSPASDLYAVGVILYELIVGERPFTGLPGKLMSAHLNETLSIPNTVPFLLRSIISTAMQKLPARRFASASEMLKAVQLAIAVEESKTESRI